MKSLDQLREQVKQKSNRQEELPLVLVLKRKSIRAYPDGQRVALYWSDKLNRHIAIPFGDVTFEDLVADIDQSVLIEFTENDKTVLVEEDAFLVGKYLDALDEKNKKLFMEIFLKDKSNCERLIQLAKEKEQ